MNTYLIITESIYLKHAIVVVIVLTIAIILSRILRKLLNNYLKSSTKKLQVSSTNYSFFKNAINLVIFILAFIIIFYTIPEFKTLGLSLFAGAGIIAAIIGFASQQAFSNIISGIFIVIFKPFRVGDIVKIGTVHFGKVEDITLRHTVINSFENRRIIIPNSLISNETITNSSIEEEKICNFLEIGISYDSDIDLAISIMQDEAMKHPDFIDNRSDEDLQNDIPPVVVRVIGFGDSSVNLRAYVWTLDPMTGFSLRCDLNKSIKERFDKEGIEIPFPYRTIVYKKDLS